MKLPENVKQTIQKFRAKKGDPPTAAPGADTEAYDAIARVWTHALCEQLRFSHGAGWGHKSASPTRPHSSDVIAYLEAPHQLVGWDLWNAVGSAEQEFVEDPDSIDLEGQTFEEVAAVDHLDGGGEDPVDPEDPEPTACVFQAEDRAAIIARLDAIDLKLAELLTKAEFAAAVNGLEDKVDAALPQILTALKAAVCKIPFKW